MHTMQKHPNGQGWLVGFAAGTSGSLTTIIRQFPNEHDAAEYVSFLNGGSAPYFWKTYFPD